MPRANTTPHTTSNTQDPVPRPLNVGGHQGNFRRSIVNTFGNLFGSRNNDGRAQSPAEADVEMQPMDDDFAYNYEVASRTEDNASTHLPSENSGVLSNPFEISEGEQNLNYQRGIDEMMAIRRSSKVSDDSFYQSEGELRPRPDYTYDHASNYYTSGQDTDLDNIIGEYDHTRSYATGSPLPLTEHNLATATPTHTAASMHPRGPLAYYAENLSSPAQTTQAGESRRTTMAPLEQRASFVPNPFEDVAVLTAPPRTHLPTPRRVDDVGAAYPLESTDVPSTEQTYGDTGELLRMRPYEAMLEGPQRQSQVTLRSRQYSMGSQAELVTGEGLGARPGTAYGPHRPSQIGLALTTSSPYYGIPEQPAAASSSRGIEIPRGIPQAPSAIHDGDDWVTEAGDAESAIYSPQRRQEKRPVSDATSYANTSHYGSNIDLIHARANQIMPPLPSPATRRVSIARNTIGYRDHAYGEQRSEGRLINSRVVRSTETIPQVPSLDFGGPSPTSQQFQQDQHEALRILGDELEAHNETSQLGVNSPRRKLQDRRAADRVQLEAIRQRNPAVIRNASMIISARDTRRTQEQGPPTPRRPSAPNSLRRLFSGPVAKPAEERQGLLWSPTVNTFKTGTDIPAAAPSPLSRPNIPSPSGPFARLPDRPTPSTLSRSARGQASTTGQRNLHNLRLPATTFRPQSFHRRLTDSELYQTHVRWTEFPTVAASASPYTVHRSTTRRVGQQAGRRPRIPVTEAPRTTRAPALQARPTDREREEASRALLARFCWVLPLALALGFGWLDVLVRRRTGGRAGGVSAGVRREALIWAGCELGFVAVVVVGAVAIWAVVRQ
ncbi:hypothetical protein MBLNU230_g7673t1 [Neophaeotheca triangularis]